MGEDNGSVQEAAVAALPFFLLNKSNIAQISTKYNCNWQVFPSDGVRHVILVKSGPERFTIFGAHAKFGASKT